MSDAETAAGKDFTAMAETAIAGAASETTTEPPRWVDIVDALRALDHVRVSQTLHVLASYQQAIAPEKLTETAIAVTPVVPEPECGEPDPMGFEVTCQARGAHSDHTARLQDDPEDPILTLTWPWTWAT